MANKARGETVCDWGGFKTAHALNFRALARIEGASGLTIVEALGKMEAGSLGVALTILEETAMTKEDRAAIGDAVPTIDAAVSNALQVLTESGLFDQKKGDAPGK